MRHSTALAAAILAAGFSVSAFAASVVQPSGFQECRTGAEAALKGAAQPAEYGFELASLTTAGDKSVAESAREMAQLHAWLTGERPASAKAAGLRVEMSRSELHSIGDAHCPECDMLRSDERRYLVGIAKPVGLEVDFASMSSKAGGYARGAYAATTDGGFVWSTDISSQGASALRVVLTGLDLPDNAELFVYNRSGEAFGPYAGRGIDGNGTVVANAITGDRVTVQLRHYGAASAADLQRTRFVISEVGHIGSRFQLAARVNPDVATRAKAFCSYNASCVNNVNCGNWSLRDQVGNGIAHMLFQSGSGFYICSGGLMGNTANDQRPLFLTANHCISRSSEASSLETFWGYETACGSNAPCDYSYTTMRSTYTTVLGATLLANGTSGDYSLMELSARPAGTRTYLGYSTGAVANSSGLDLFRISHPQGAPQSFSTQDVNTTAGTCQTLPRGAFIYSTDSDGATEGGSSGSPVVNASGLVVGQLYGACGTNLNDVCDSGSNRTVDGALAAYYPNVSAYLAPGGGGGGTVAHVGNIVLSRQAMNGGRTRGVATVTVLNASNQPVSGATVSGSFSGFYSGSASGVTNASGVATLTSRNKKGSGTVSFCVNGISGSGISYNSAANTETCDTF